MKKGKIILILVLVGSAFAAKEQIPISETNRLKTQVQALENLVAEQQDTIDKLNSDINHLRLQNQKLAARCRKAKIDISDIIIDKSRLCFYAQISSQHLLGTNFSPRLIFCQLCIQIPQITPDSPHKRFSPI